MSTEHKVPNDIKSLEYEAFFAKYYAKNIENSLFDYIDKISIKNYAKNILQSIKFSIEALNNPNVANIPNLARSSKVQHIVDISNVKKIDIELLDKLLNKIPALMPIALQIIDMKNKLHKMVERNVIINAITIHIDKKALLKELWGNNLCVGFFPLYRVEEALPLIKKQWYLYPEIQNDYLRLGYLYLAIDKAIYQCVLKLEDRLLLDINSLLDIYCYTQDSEDEFTWCCCPPMIPDVEDKLDDIMTVNVVKPKKEEAIAKENKTYVDAYNDYMRYKEVYQVLKLLIEIVKSKYCKKFAKDFIENASLSKDIYYITNSQLENFVKCPLSKTRDCDYLNKKSCKHKNLKTKGVLETLYNIDEEVYRLLTISLDITNDKELFKFINSCKTKEFGMTLIKKKYHLLSEKSVKTISNKFSEYEKILIEHSKKQKDIEYEQHIAHISRDDRFDDKDFEDTTTNEIIYELLTQIYTFYETYTESQNERVYVKIKAIIKKLEKLIK